MNVVAVCICVVGVVLCSGAIYNLVDPNINPRFSFVFVGLFIGVAVFGLKTMYSSRYMRNPLAHLFLGFLLVFVAYFALEFLFLTNFGR